MQIDSRISLTSFVNMNTPVIRVSVYWSRFAVIEKLHRVFCIEGSPNVAYSPTPNRCIGFIGFIIMQHTSLPNCGVHKKI